MKLRVLDKDVAMVMVRSGGKAHVLLSGGAWLITSPAVLKESVRVVRTDVLAELVPGMEAEFYVRTQTGWYLVISPWCNVGQSDFRTIPVKLSDPRMRAVINGLQARRAYLSMKDWIAQQLLAEPVL